MTKLKGPRTGDRMAFVGMGFLGKGQPAPPDHFSNFVLNVRLKPNHPTIDPCFAYLHSTSTE